MRDKVVDAIESAKHSLDTALSSLEQLPETNSDKIAYTAHKLRNYLSVMSAARDLLELYLSGHPEEQVRAWIEGMQHAHHLMDHELGLMLHAANGSEPMPRIERVDLGLLAFRACNFYRRRAEWKKIEVHSEVKDLECYARTDRIVAAAVLDNLLSNALKFSDSGKNVWVTVEKKENRVICRVRDEGPGLSEDDQQRLFQSGVRFSNEPTGGERSSGFGLAIAKELMGKIGGEIGCHSNVGQGATFILRFPVDSGMEAPTEASTKYDSGS